MRCNSEDYEGDEPHKIDVINQRKYRARIKSCENNKDLAREEHYNYVQTYFRWKVRNHKLIYLVCKSILCFLHFHLESVDKIRRYINNIRG